MVSFLKLSVNHFIDDSMKIMTDNQFKNYIKKIDESIKNLTKESAYEFLLKTGIYTKTGRLKKPYK